MTAKYPVEQTDFLGFKVSEAEGELIRTAAHRAEMSLSEFAREVLTSAALRQLEGGSD